MEKIKSASNPNKYIYYELEKNKQSNTLIVFLSGFSGSRDFPFLKRMSKMFRKKGFSVLRLNFCTDSEDATAYKSALDLSEITFSTYNKELKNILEKIQYSKYILIGHSFGTPIFIDFLNKNKSFLNKSELVLWEPSLLPWNKNTLSKVFLPNKNVYTSSDGKESLNKIFFKEVTTIDSVSKFSKIKKDVLLISAKGSCDKDAKKYFNSSKNKKTSLSLVLENTDHCFKGKSVQKILLEKTLDFIKNKFSEN